MTKQKFVVLVLALVSAPPAQGLTPIQVMQIRTVSSVIDAGEQGILFTRIVPRTSDRGVGRAGRYLFQLVPDGAGGFEEKLLLTEGGGYAMWGDKLTFTGRPKDSAHAEVLSMSLRDGKVARVTLTPNGVRSFKWSPNFRYIAFTQMDARPERASKRINLGFKQKIFDEDYRDIRLYLWDSRTGAVSRLTTKGTVFGYEWSPDSSRLAAAIAPRNLVDDSYMFKRIHTVDLNGKVKKVIDNPGKLGDMAWSPDGTKLAYISAADKRDPHAGMVYLLDIDTGKSKPLTEGFLGAVAHIRWGHGPKIQAQVSKGVRTFVATIDPEKGELEVIAGGGDLSVSGFSWRKDRQLVVASTGAHPAEVFELDGSDTKRLTNSNPWLSKVELGRQEAVRISTRDHVEIEGLLLYPVGYQEGKRYPMVIVAHGGPESHFVDGWNTSYSRWGQMLCARGYFAWYPNYRSSTGYGVDFTKHDHGDLMGGEFNDHIDAIAHFDRQGLIDPKRVGIGGGSYGGYTAAWAATKGTEHFAAAVSFVPFVDIRTKWYTTDIPWEFYYVHYQETHAHEQAGYLRDRSPLTHAARCRTPLLLLGGTADPRVHPSQPHMLYRAVKFATKTPVRYVQYPGEGHGNRTNTNQYDYALRTLRWFDHYLKPGDHREDPPPSYEVDYTEWYRRV